MKKTGIQFHVTHDEVAEILKNLCAEKVIYACMVSNNPFSVENLNANDDPKLLDLSGVNFNGLNFIYFGEKPFFSDCESIADFRKKNEHHTSLLVGKQNSSMLQDSMLGCVALNEEQYKFGKSVCEFVKKYTVAGLIPIGADGQRGKLNKIFRYTHGAKDLYSKGIELRSMVGGAHFEIPSS